MFCLNVCEIFRKELLEGKRLEVLAELARKESGHEEEELSRIYGGSSFCSQYFLHINGWKELIQHCQENGWKMTLTVPVFTQKDLDTAKERIHQVLQEGEGVIDEITVNDVGMLRYLFSQYPHKLNLGRLFFKDPRDARVRGYSDGSMTPAWLSSVEYMRKGLGIEKEKIGGIELDWMSHEVNLSGCKLDGLNLGVHGPFCYMSTGNICKFASIPKPLEKKFRPNAQCGMECAKISEKYREDFGGKTVDILRYGRTIYYYEDDSRIIGKETDREIYFPVVEIKEVTKEGV